MEYEMIKLANQLLQALIRQFESVPRYWSMDKPHYEVDYLIQRGNDIFPIEVKCEGNVKSIGLKKFAEKYGDKVKLRIRFSMNNLKLDHDVLNIPMFMADYADKLIRRYLRKKKYEERI